MVFVSQSCLIAALVSVRAGSRWQGASAGCWQCAALCTFERSKQEQPAPKDFVGWLPTHSTPPFARKTAASAPSDAAGTYIPVKVQAAANINTGSSWEQLIVRLPSGLPQGAVQLEVARGGYTSPAKVSHAPLAASWAYTCHVRLSSRASAVLQR